MIKNLPQGWRVEKLGNGIICDLIMGQSPDSKSYNQNNEGLPFFQGKKEFGKIYPIVEQYCSKPNKTALENDILLSVRAPVGALNIANLECCIGRGLAAIRVNKSHLISKYLFFFIQKFVNKFIEKSNGSTFEAITKKELEKIDIIVPPLPQQEKIVKVLDNSASLVEQQKQLIEKYDVFLKSKFIEMFGDPITNPMGWKIEKLGDIVELLTYGLTVRPLYIENGIVLISAREIRTGTIDYSSAPKISKTDFDKLSEKAKPSFGDILFSKTGSIGHSALVENNQEFAITQNAARIVPKQSIVISKFLLSFFRTDHFIALSKNEAKGNAVQDLQLGTMSKFSIYCPPLVLQNKFASIVEKIEAIKEKETQKLNHLETLHVSLMDKAFKGEIG